MRWRVLFSILTFATGASAQGTITKGPWVQRLSETSATVKVELGSPGAVTLELGAGTAASRDGAAPRTFESKEAKSLHSIDVGGLEPGTKYPYSVHAQGTSKHAAFTTAPKRDASGAFHFLVYGDNRTDDAAHAAVIRAMMSVPSDFVVNTGDFVASGDSSAEWQRFFEIEAPLLSERCIFSCVGNHELTDGKGANYIRYFGPTNATATNLPEHINGTFRWGTARFFLMNAMTDWQSGPDRSWLEKTLAEADDEAGLVWRIAVLHHGPWSSGPHGNNTRLHRANIPSTLRNHKIDLVIAGHDHIYERGWAEGMAYLVSGGGGAPTYPIKTQLPSARKTESVRHFIDLAVSTPAIQLVAIRADSSTIERCALRKESDRVAAGGGPQGGWDCDAAPTSTASSRTPDPPPASRCSCRAAGLPGAASAAPVAVLAAAAFVARRRAGNARRTRR